MELTLEKKIIYKLYDTDDVTFEPKYFTLHGLQFYVVNEMYDEFQNTMSENKKQDFTQVELVNNHENLFTYIQLWGYRVDRIILFDTKEIYTTTN